MSDAQDWRAPQTRRAIAYIEQSIAAALLKLQFAPNDAATWAAAIATVSAFLTQAWTQGLLPGDAAEGAFTVECGLNSTMNSQDIADGVLKLAVTLQIVRPGESTVLNFTQRMQAS